MNRPGRHRSRTLDRDSYSQNQSVRDRLLIGAAASITCTWKLRFIDKNEEIDKMLREHETATIIEIEGIPAFTEKM